ncbi:MAG: hypothetical protein RIC51_01255 [Erythrobacter sp.]|uniref:hypothetical protein n=1 Tax=Erythrobacter sp. TaxID=1042 RepID=UPI0032EF3C47
MSTLAHEIAGLESPLHIILDIVVGPECGEALYPIRETLGAISRLCSIVTRTSPARYGIAVTESS